MPKGDYYADDGQAHWHQGRDDGAKEDHEDDQCNRDADALSLTQVAFRQFILFVGDTGIPHYQHAEAVLAVSLVDDVQHRLDVLQRLVEVAS